MIKNMLSGTQNRAPLFFLGKKDLEISKKGNMKVSCFKIFH